MLVFVEKNVHFTPFRLQFWMQKKIFSLENWDLHFSLVLPQIPKFLFSLFNCLNFASFCFSFLPINAMISSSKLKSVDFYRSDSIFILLHFIFDSWIRLFDNSGLNIWWIYCIISILLLDWDLLVIWCLFSWSIIVSCALVLDILVDFVYFVVIAIIFFLVHYLRILEEIIRWSFFCLSRVNASYLW